MSGNSTYFYKPPDPIVYVDDAQTAGFSHWPGAEFLELMRQVSRNSEVDYRFDLLAVRRLVILRAQILGSGGARSFVLEFDPVSKLLVGMTLWNNLDRSGSPDFQADSVTYLDSAPDSLFEPQLPGNVSYRKRDVWVAPEMIGLLSAPGAGLRLPGLSQEEASQKIVQDIYAAEIQADFARFKELAPVAMLWDDEQLTKVIGGIDGKELVTELVELGPARERGQSALGPLMVVPVVVQHKDGRLYQHKLIVQIRREAGSDFSSVVYGPYGVPYPMD